MNASIDRRSFLAGSALAALAVGLRAQVPSPGARRPNVLFIAVDDLRPSLGCYGDKMARTPNLDRFASGASLFENAYCQQAVCSPSRTSLLTGLRPDSTKIYDLKTHFRTTVPDVVTLPQAFKEAGWKTIARGKIYHGSLDDAKSWTSPPSEGVSLAGGEYSLVAGSGGDPKAEGQAGKKLPPYEIGDGPDEAYGDGRLAREAEAFLAAPESKEGPFFYAVGFSKPHLPFNAPKKYWDLHDREALWPPPNRKLPEGAAPFSGQPSWELRNRYSEVPADYAKPIDLEVEKKLRHGYYAATSFVDAQIGRVLDALDRSGHAGNTVVILWGDHGYHVGDHGFWNKHTNFEVATHAPLLLRTPGQKKGNRVTIPVEFVDVFPTLAEACGLPVTPAMEGESLLAAIGSAAIRKKRTAFSQYPRGNAKAPIMGYTLRHDRWRYTEWLRTDTGEVTARELYDLVADPHCFKSVHEVPAHKDLIRDLSTRLAGAGKGVAEARRKATAPS